MGERVRRELLGKKKDGVGRPKQVGKLGKKRPGGRTIPKQRESSSQVIDDPRLCARPGGV